MGEIVREVTIEEPYGFIYITTNMVNGKRYLGRRKFSEDWKYYLGSGKVFRRAIKEYGRENFIRHIIDIAYTEEELNQKEYDYSVEFDVVESDDWYNLVYGGGTTTGYKMSDETKEKIGNKAKARLSNPENHPMYGKQGLSGEQNPMYGVSPKERMDEETYERWKKHLYTKGNKEVYCPEMNMFFSSITQAARYVNTSKDNIGAVLHHKHQYAGRHPNTNQHLTWYYVLDQERTDKTELGAISLGVITQNDYDNWKQNLNKGD